MAKVRINKYIADCGVTSRRGADALIAEGVVTVNGHILRELGMQIDPDVAVVKVRGVQIGLAEKKLIYVAVNKPVDYVSTVKDVFADKTVLDLFSTKERVYPVGRLDKDSEGLLLLTNDGDLSLKLTHPRYGVPKTYHVLVVGKAIPEALNKMKSGVLLEDGYAKALSTQVLSHGSFGVWIEVVLLEGKKREIRRMCAALHLHVVRLIRVAIGEVRLGDLKDGAWRMLSEVEIKKLKASSLG